MDERFIRDDLFGRFVHLMEECNELCAIGNKMLRWGAYSYDPTISEEDREYNITAVTRELRDVMNTSNEFTQLLVTSTHKEIEEAFDI